MTYPHLPITLLAVTLTALTTTGAADDVRVAVASNFRPVLEELAIEFEAQSGHRLVVISGSSGKHYAQIMNGAPFDAFLAADSERPARLEAEGASVAGSRFTYALGKLVLWSRDEKLVDQRGSVLGSGNFRHLAIANPELAPYGRAARETLQALKAWEGVEARLVRGENIGQAYQFVHSGNAELGLLALSQLRHAGGSSWLVPGHLYSPIEQQAVLLIDTAAGRAFMAYLAGTASLQLIREFGYDTPP